MMKRRSALRHGCKEYLWDRLARVDHTVLNAKLILLQSPCRWLVDQVFLSRNTYMHGDMLYVRVKCWTWVFIAPKICLTSFYIQGKHLHPGLQESSRQVGEIWSNFLTFAHNKSHKNNAWPYRQPSRGAIFNGINGQLGLLL